jgi:deazaflavin-dependent oxidoreductase (nitroreductase family)
MWLLNHIANPLILFLLRSRLHGLVSGSLLVITVHGRRSGKRYTLPVNYAQDGDRIIILPGAPEKKTWWRNLDPGAEVELILHGEKRTAWAEVVRGERNLPAAVQGLRLYFQKYPQAAKMRGIARQADGSYPTADVQQAAALIILVQAALTSADA